MKAASPPRVYSSQAVASSFVQTVKSRDSTHAVLVVDGSGSISTGDFQTIKISLRSLVENGLNGSLVSIIQFASVVREEGLPTSDTPTLVNYIESM